MTSFISKMNYSSAFPPLQSFPWAFPTVNNNHHTNIHNNNHLNQYKHTSINTIISKYPAYLKHTNYAHLVSEQCNKNLIEEIDLRLPQFWNKNDKAKYIDVGMNGYDLYYSGFEPFFFIFIFFRGKYLMKTIGPGKKELDAATIRTNFPIRPQCGIYYFEIKVISKGEDGFICIGFCRAANKLERLPGNER